jgi:glucose-6-phosphate isomerase
MLKLNNIVQSLDLKAGAIAGGKMVQRRLSDLRGCFQNSAAFDSALKSGDPMLYTVSSVEPAGGDGDLHYGLGVLMPGRIGDEYYMTKGHFHSWREAAEVYIGLSGSGCMLLQDEASGESQMAPLAAHGVVYVPGNTAHRTINTGSEPLVYLGIYSAKAGHDYGSISETNFNCVVIERAGKPVMLPRN